MSFEPKFAVSARLLRDLEAIANLRANIAAATIQVTWVPQLQKDSRERGAHASTAIEGNPLTLAEVRALERRVEPAHRHRCPGPVRGPLTRLIRTAGVWPPAWRAPREPTGAG